MGLLDDAIREHLDLKRRRGADPAEVERAEREALGPVRRNREPEEGEFEPAAEQAPQAGPADDRGDACAYDHEADDHDWVAGERGSEHRDWAQDREAGEQVEAETFGDDPFESEPDEHGSWAEHDPESFPTAPPAPRRTLDHAGSETAEYDVERALSADEENDDVLEGTPEFLQDTPDHDRLWFEQRPPRDFDFDD